MIAYVEAAGRLIGQAQRVVALTGAGLSTPSGIPDFRLPTLGVLRQANPPVVALLASFRRDPRPFFHWIGPLLRTMLRAQPNPAHDDLTELEHGAKLIIVNRDATWADRSGALVLRNDLAVALPQIVAHSV